MLFTNSHKKCPLSILSESRFGNSLALAVTTLSCKLSGVSFSLLDLQGVDRIILMRALKLLEHKGKLAIFKGTSADDEGIKFSSR